MGDQSRTHTLGYRHCDHVGQSWVQKRFATEEADVANTSIVKDLQGGIEWVSIDPSQVLAFHFAIREVAEVALGVAGIGDGNIAQGRAAVPYEAEHIPSFRPDGRQ